jgi:hypothetical protein
MIYNFLQMIEKGGYQSHLEIARRMAISPVLVMQIARDITRRGYLEETGGSCDVDPAQPVCSGCAASSACQTAFSLWSLTAKGRQAVSSHAAL